MNQYSEWLQPVSAINTPHTRTRKFIVSIKLSAKNFSEMAYFAHLLSFLVLTTALMFFFISPSHSIPSPPPPAKPPKVDLVLYYETLCPGCADFITIDLVKVFQTDLNTIVNFKLVPWGNAKVINGTIVCQHSEDECYLNIIDACIIKAWPEVKKHFPFIRCIEAENSAMQVKHSKDVEKSWRKCAHNLAFPQEPIDECYNSGEGMKLTLRYSNETPPHDYVPWVTVDNVPLKEVIPDSHLQNYQDYKQYVCKAYKGKPVEACKSKLSSSTLKDTSTNPVCYTEKSSNSLFFAADDSET